ncbi:tail fiber domain-containing protein [Chryseobacterium kwangjuense]|uniref:Tail fiber domain-containing protein n=1 Tax=Chryseobacterium kwangjuense TaxID=267125 RepID=A0A135WJX2_9FLAO|nr:tail fiber domain-containing protein [Chryseobacterium kwangjuense]KXH85150.1 hypothetical protein AU378_05195 [Chryseobacterium kwangjuense]
MKQIRTSLSLLLLSAAAFTVSAQNVWTGTTTPTTTTGSVGIGNTAPTSRLDINSGSSISGLKINHVYRMFGSNAPNIVEIYNQVGNILPPVDPVMINWLSYGGVFGLRSLSNAANESRMMYNDNLGNLKSSSLVMYSSPSFGNGTSINSIRGVAYLNFLNGGNGSPSGFGTVSGGANGIYMARLGIGVDASSTYDLDVLFGTVRAQAFVTSSDKRLKDNIQPLKELSPNLMNIKSYSYTFKNNQEGEKKADTQKLHFGFIAQEVEKEFPNLVSIDEKGNYALNYIEFIPLLLNELKDQKKEINDLKERMAALEAKINGAPVTSKMVPGKEISASSFSLEQNVPNPFNQETVIRFNAAGDNVSIGIYDLAGRQLQTIPVKKGEKQISVSARTLTPGTYIYNLQVDGKLIDSKKMIVTN